MVCLVIGFHFGFLPGGRLRPESYNRHHNKTTIDLNKTTIDPFLPYYFGKIIQDRLIQLTDGSKDLLYGAQLIIIEN